MIYVKLCFPKGYNVLAIHGDLKQNDRERHLEQFRAGTSPILVATVFSFCYCIKTVYCN